VLPMKTTAQHVTPLVVCPWCPAFDRRDPRHAGLSHAMCATCAAAMHAALTRLEGL